MTFSSNQSQNTNQLPTSLDIKPGEPEFESELLLYLRRVANSVNTKGSGLYLPEETASFEQWFGATPQENRSGYRLTLDLVALKGVSIPVGTTSIILSPTTQPPNIDGYMFPVQGFGGALGANGISYFPSDPNVTITYQDSTNTIVIINNTGSVLTFAVWVMEYLKS